MKRQNFYANFPTKLYQENFKSDKDRNFHLLAMAYFVSFVHTGDGYFYISKNRLAQLLKCSTKKALEILHNLEEWGYIEKQKEGVNHHSQTVYRIATYDFDFTSEEILQDDAQISEDLGTTKIHHKNTPAETSNINDDSEFENQQNTPLKEQQTNNDKTNNEKTNNEIKTNNEEKIESVNEDFEMEKESEIQQLYTELAQEDIAPTEQELDRELNKLIGMYPKKTANFRKLRERFWNLRLKHNLFFEQIQEAVENYVLEMKSQEFDEKYLKNLDTLLDYVELEPFLFKPVLAIDKKGKRFRGEFCIATGCLRYRVNESRIESQYIDSKKFERMLDEERLIFLDDSKKQDKGELVNAA